MIDAQETIWMVGKMTRVTGKMSWTVKKVSSGLKSSVYIVILDWGKAQTDCDTNTLIELIMTQRSPPISRLVSYS